MWCWCSAHACGVSGAPTSPGSHNNTAGRHLPDPSPTATTPLLRPRPGAPAKAHSTRFATGWDCPAEPTTAATYPTGPTPPRAATPVERFRAAPRHPPVERLTTGSGHPPVERLTTGSGRPSDPAQARTVRVGRRTGPQPTAAGTGRRRAGGGSNDHHTARPVPALPAFPPGHHHPDGSRTVGHPRSRRGRSHGRSRGRSRGRPRVSRGGHGAGQAGRPATRASVGHRRHQSDASTDRREHAPVRRGPGAAAGAGRGLRRPGTGGYLPFTGRSDPHRVKQRVTGQGGPVHSFRSSPVRRWPAGVGNRRARRWMRSGRLLDAPEPRFAGAAAEDRPH